MRSHKEVESEIARVICQLHEEVIEEGHLGDLMPEIVQRCQKVDGLLVKHLLLLVLVNQILTYRDEEGLVFGIASLLQIL